MDGAKDSPRMHAAGQQERPAENARDWLRGRSQGEIARAACITPQALGLILDGKRDPRMSTAMRLADAFRVSLERFVRACVRAQEQRAARARAAAVVARLTR